MLQAPAVVDALIDSMRQSPAVHNQRLARAVIVWWEADAVGHLVQSDLKLSVVIDEFRIVDKITLTLDAKIGEIGSFNERARRRQDTLA